MSTVEFDSSGPEVVNVDGGRIGILKADEDLSTDFGFVVEQVTTSDLAVVKTTGASEKVVGVTGTKRPSGRKIQVITRGIVVVTAGAAIARADRLKSAATGRVAVWISGTDNASLIIGIALQAAAASGDKIKILLKVG